ncbi:MAG: TetR/AcrR family transcriptional regulator [Terriglobales bacterium]
MQARVGIPSSHDRILQSAKHLFATRGYENTSTIMIARAAGTSESQLVKHFGSKDGLLESIFNQGWQSMQPLFAAVDKCRSPVEKLHGLVNQMLVGLERDPELKQLMLLESRRIRRAGNSVLLTQGFFQFSRRMEEILAEIRAEGQLRHDLRPPVVRSALMGMVEGMLRDQLIAKRMGADPGFTDDDIRLVVDTALTSCLASRASGAVSSS